MDNSLIISTHWSASISSTRKISSVNSLRSCGSSYYIEALKSLQSPKKRSPRLSFSSIIPLKCSFRASCSSSGNFVSSFWRLSQSSRIDSIIVFGFSNPRPALAFYFLLIARKPTSRVGGGRASLIFTLRQINSL